MNSPPPDPIGLLLHQALGRNDLDQALVLCQQGARADRSYSLLARPALLWAIEQGSLAALEALLPFGDPQMATASGITPLMLACSMERVDMVELLLPLSDPWFLDEDGDRALDWLGCNINDGRDNQHALAPILELFARLDPTLVQASADRFDDAFLQACLRAIAKVDCERQAQEISRATPAPSEGPPGAPRGRL